MVWLLAREAHNELFKNVFERTHQRVFKHAEEMLLLFFFFNV